MKSLTKKLLFLSLIITPTLDVLIPSYEQLNEFYLKSRSNLDFVIPFSNPVKKKINTYIFEGLMNSKNSSVVDENFVKKIIKKESNNNAFAYGNFKERGLMQISKEAWEQVENKKPYEDYAFDSKMNIQVGINYLKWIEDYLSEKILSWDTLSDNKKQIFIVAGYNCGAPKLSRLKFDLDKVPITTKKYIHDVFY
jgi:membrane-bound lytic murein transglycosylase MltF